MALKYAKDQNNEDVDAQTAEAGKTYWCKHCGARVHKRISKIGNAYFVCYNGEQHTHKICKLLVARAVTHTTVGLDGKQLLDGLISPPKNQGHNGPQERDSHIHTIKVEDDDGNDKKSVDREDEGGIEKPFSSLKQIWDEGLPLVLKPEQQLGSLRAIDCFIFEKWFSAGFARFNGGARVIQAHPKRILWGNKILLECSWVRSDNNRQEYHDLRMCFPDSKLYKEYCDMLFSKVEKANGTVKSVENYQWILVAGLWEPYQDTSAKGAHYSGHKCVVSRKKQIQPCDTEIQR